MDFLSAIRISTSGLNAQRTRMNVVSSNLANINTTRTPEGGDLPPVNVPHGVLVSGSSIQAVEA